MVLLLWPAPEVCTVVGRRVAPRFAEEIGRWVSTRQAEAFAAGLLAQAAAGTLPAPRAVASFARQFFVAANHIGLAAWPPAFFRWPLWAL